MIEITQVMTMLLLFLLVWSATAIVFSKNLMISAVLMALFSLMMAAQYLLMGAVDVAITEAAVGAGFSTILLLLALFRVGHKEKKSSTNSVFALIVVGVVFAGLVYATFDMPYYGDAYAPSQIHVAPYYLDRTLAEIGIPNVVTAILASYRGYDTLGETVVIMTAAMAVMLLLGQFGKKDGDNNG